MTDLFPVTDEQAVKSGWNEEWKKWERVVCTREWHNFV